MKYYKLNTRLTVLLMVIFLTKSFALVKPNSLFSNNMVLQRGVAVPIWGTANDGEKVTVEFNGQKVTTVAKDGKWKVNLKALKASIHKIENGSTVPFIFGLLAREKIRFSLRTNIINQ